MDVELLKKLDAAFVKHRTDMRAKISDYAGLSFPVTKNAKWGLLKIRYAHMQTMTSRLVTDGFKKVGMVPYCIDTIINNCTTKFTEAEYHQLIDALPRLVKIVRQRGQLTWADYLSVGIDLLDDVDKDTVSLAHKRCVILTNPNVIAICRNVHSTLLDFCKKQRILYCQPLARIPSQLLPAHRCPRHPFHHPG